MAKASATLPTLPDDSSGQASYTIGIGASAGGLDALKAFFDHVPDDCPHSFVVVQHLPSDYKSLMAELLAQNTSLSIHEATEGMVIEPNSVYLIPSGKNLTLEADRLRLHPKPPGPMLNLPIDIFLSSLAEQKGSQAIGIILSGTGSDGTRGVRAIKEVGGMVMVQSPLQAQFDGMPQSAIRTNLVDIVMPVEKLPGELYSYIEHPSVQGNLHNIVLQDDGTFATILNHIFSATGIDFSQYKRPTLSRRLSRRMNLTQCDSLRDYLNVLHSSSDEVQHLVREFLIGVTKFFRDKQVWQVFREQVLPQVLHIKASQNDLIKVWIVGCSTGEEVYTLAMLLHQEMKRQERQLEVKIYATDLSKEALSIASRGIYPESVVADIPLDLLQQYFQQVGEEYKIINEVRRMVIFSQHDILRDPAFNRMDIVVCRNMLIYFNQQAQVQAMGKLHYALKLGGYLLLGSSETASNHQTSLEEIDRKVKLYRNINENRLPGFHGQNLSQPSPHQGFKQRRPKSPSLQVAEVMGDALSEELKLATICINEAFEIVHATGNVRDFISLPEQGYSVNLLQLVPEALSTAISLSVRKAQTQGNNVRYNNVRIHEQDQIRTINVIVRPFKLSGSHQNNFVVILIPQEVEATSTIVSNVSPTQAQRVKVLEEELSDARENLQATVEEVETSNEELQATNEELLAANEELQSSNEEMQSINEELHTVNGEYQSKLDELIVLNAEFDNLLNSSDIGTLFLDQEACIRRITPAIHSHFQLRESDIGRPLAHFASQFGGETNSLVAQAKQVMNSGEQLETEIQHASGTWYLQRVNPYRNDHGEIEGAVISFIDISALKQAETLAKDAARRLTEAQRIARLGDFEWDVSSGEITWSRALFELVGYDPDEQMSIKKVQTSIHHPDDTERVQAWLEEAVNSGRQDLPANEYRVLSKDGELLYIRTVGRIEHGKNGSIKVFGTSQDITELRKAQENLYYQSFVLQSISDAVIITDLNFSIQSWNSIAQELYGWTTEEVIGQRMSVLVPTHYPDETTRQKALEQLRTRGYWQGEVIQTTKDGQELHVLASVAMVRDVNKQPIGVVAVNRDLSDRIRAEREARQREELRRSNAALEQFAYVASHDLQEPLRTVSSYTSLLAEEYKEHFDEDGRKGLHFITQATDRMSALIKSLLDYSRLGRNTSFTEVDCKALIQTICDDMSLVIQESNTVISYDNLPTLQGLKTELRMLFQNLISNAIKFRRDQVQPRITISASADKNYWTFTVQDNGIGIDEQFFERIFLIFQRLHNQRHYEGTGIGLSHCKRIVEIHGGEIWVTSTPGQGSSFHFTLLKQQSEAST